MPLLFAFLIIVFLAFLTFSVCLQVQKDAPQDFVPKTGEQLAEQKSKDTMAPAAERPQMSAVSWISFAWLQPMLRQGFHASRRSGMTFSDLQPIWEGDDVVHVCKQATPEWEEMVRAWRLAGCPQGQEPSLMTLLNRVCWGKLLAIYSLKGANTFIMLAMPVLVNGATAALTSNPAIAENVTLYSSLMVLFSLLFTIVSNQARLITVRLDIWMSHFLYTASLGKAGAVAYQARPSLQQNDFAVLMTVDENNLVCPEGRPRLRLCPPCRRMS